MKEAKFTKGKWYAVEYAGFVNIQTEPTYGGANLLDMEAAPEEEVRANANLCTAAPAMYEALERIANHFDVTDWEALAKEMADVAREALTQANL